MRSASYGARSFGSVALRVRPSRVSTQLYLLDLQPAIVLEEVEPGHALALIMLTRREEKGFFWHCLSWLWAWMFWRQEMRRELKDLLDLV